MSKRDGFKHISTYVDQETQDQIAALSQVFHLPVSCLIRQAIARWYHSDPMIKKNGSPPAAKRGKRRVQEGV